MELFIVLFYWILVTGLGAVVMWVLDSRKQIASRISEIIVGALTFGLLMFLIL